MDSIKLDGTQAFALYSLPNQTEVNVVFNSTSSESKSIDFSDIDNAQGFLFTSFLNNGKAELIEGNLIESIDLSEITYNSVNKEFKYSKEIDFGMYSESFYNYLNAFDDAFSKAILSRPIDIPIPENIDPIQLFKVLNDKYQNAFVSLIYTSNHGMWIGATPEVLLCETEDDYQTVALAGTQPYSENLTWQQKEIDEQAIVTDYICNQLDELDIQYFKTEPETIQAGNLAHLKTTFLINQNTAYAELLKALHPTPAVCGMPKDKALELIAENEQYDRELYTGFLGPSFDKTDLFVNLRCMQLFKGKARVYVGGGLTKDSELEKEWEETELKAQTMLSILENNRTLHS